MPIVSRNGIIQIETNFPQPQGHNPKNSQIDPKTDLPKPFYLI